MESPKPTNIRFSENLEDFFKCVVKLVDDASVSHPNNIIGEVEPIQALYKIMAVYDPADIMRLFVTYTHEHWDQVKKRDPTFFDATTKLLQNLLSLVPVKNLNPELFKLIQDTKVNDEYVVHRETVAVLWEYWDAFVIIMIDHVHTMRKPKTCLKAGVRTAVYTAKYVPVLDIRKACRTWSVDLRF